MLIELIIALIAGIIIGVIAGLMPGIHPNLITVLITSYIASLTFAPPLSLVIFIVSMAITNTFVNFIPSIFLGAPDDDNFLSTLPGHQMLKKGKAHEAVVLTLYGSLLALIIILIFTPIFIYLLPLISAKIKTAMPFLLIFLSLYLILREEKIILGIFIFLFSGFLGFATLNLPVNQPLFPLLTGLFGSSSLILSLKQKVKIPEQKIQKLKKIKITKKELTKSIAGSVASAPLCSFLPGIGSGHAATISSEFFNHSTRGFLVSLGAINTIVEGLSFIALYSIGKGRTGTAVAVKQIMNSLNFQNLAIIIATIIISGLIAALLTINLSKLASKLITKLKYEKLSIYILILLLLLTIIISKPLGILILITSTALGIFTILSNSRRINLMGCLLIPVILFYLF